MKSRILTRCGFFVQFGDRALPPYSFFCIFHEISVGLYDLTINLNSFLYGKV